MLSAGQLLALVNGLGGIVWEADADTFRFTFVSDEAERILGYPASTWLEPDFWRRHTHPDDIERCTVFCREATSRGEDHEFEYRMIAADGRIVWLRDIVSVRRLPGEPNRLMGIALDITAEKEEEADKHRLSRLYEALIENSSDNVSLLRADGITVYQSAVVMRSLGYEPHELVGRNNFHLVHPDDAAEAGGRFQEVFTGDGVIGPVRYRFKHKDGSWRCLETVAKRFTGEGGESFAVANTRDVTEMVNAQRQLEATQEQLAQAMKMEAVGRLAGGVAHDFNNLLTVIAGYAELVAASLEPDDARGDDITEIKRAAHRASLLTRQLLTFSRKHVLRAEVLDLNAVVLEVGVLIRRLIGEDVQLVLDPTPEPVRVLVDRSQIEQVLMNLAVNARDAMPLGGRLVIRTTAGEGKVELTVSDNGSGMPPHVLARVFEPFFTTKEIGKGTGLGLSTAYGIVKQAGGDIDVKSEVEAGTCFTITLPVVKAPEPRLAVNDENAPRGVETVLVVEDEDQVRSLIEDVLSRHGYRVLAARDGRTAVEICRRQQMGISLLLTDVVMGQMSGPQVFAEISAIVPGIAVLYISGYTGAAVFSRGVRDESPAYLQKPFTPAALAWRVREVLDEHARQQRAG